MANLWLIVQEHNIIQEGGAKKHHICEESKNVTLCGRSMGFDKTIFGSQVVQVDFDYICSNPVSLLMKEICIKCLKRAIDIIDKENDE